MEEVGLVEESMTGKTQKGTGLWVRKGGKGWSGE